MLDLFANVNDGDFVRVEFKDGAIEGPVTIDDLNDAETDGLTWKELADINGWHHGQASGVLSTLHKANLVCRLTQRRNRCAVYVLWSYQDGRDYAARTVKKCKHCGGEL